MKYLSVKLMALLFVFSALQVSGKTPYEFSVYAGGGYACFLYRLPNAEVPVPRSNDLYYPAISGVSSSGSAGELGVGFTGFITPQIGLHVGLGLGLHNVGTNVDSLKIYKDDVLDDITGYHGDWYTTLFDYRETHRTFSLSIPFMIQFQTMQNQSGWNRRNDAKQGFYAMAGVKLNILLNNTYESKMASIYNLEHVLDLDNWADTQEFIGLGKHKGKSSKGDFGYVQALLAIEAGMKWRVSDNMYLYTGAYLDYGLNDPGKNSKTPLDDYDYRFPKDMQLELLGFADRTNLLVIGIKLRLAFIKYFDQMSCPQF